MYNAILKWSLNQSDGFDSEESRNGDGPALEPMSNERKEFLMRAMKQYIVNETERINDIVEILKFAPAQGSASSSASASGSKEDDAAPAASNYAAVIKAAVDIKVDGGEPDIAAMLEAVPATALADMKLEALRELRDRVEQVDNASFFAVNCNGKGELGLVLDLMLHHPSGRVRVAAAGVLSTVLQNNPAAQQKAAAIPGFVQVLLGLAVRGGRRETAAPAGVDAIVGKSLATGETVEEQAERMADLQTAAFAVLTSYVRGTNAVARLSLFLSPQVGGPEFLADVLRSIVPEEAATREEEQEEAGSEGVSRQQPHRWVRYTPSGATEHRQGWWRPLPANAAVDAGSEVAMDLTTGEQWLRYAGTGGDNDDDDDRDPNESTTGSRGGQLKVDNVNPRLVSKVVFFLQFILRELARSKDSEASVARLLHSRLQLTGTAGEALARLASNTSPEAAATSEAAATVLQLLLTLPQSEPAVKASEVILNGGGSALIELPSGEAPKAAATPAPSSSAEAAAEAAGHAADNAPARVGELLAVFVKRHGAAIKTACAEQEQALVESAGGDAEQLSYLEEPRNLFKALAQTVEKYSQ